MGINGRVASSEKIAGILQDTFAGSSSLKLSELVPTSEESIYILAAFGGTAVLAAGVAAYIHLSNLDSDFDPENVLIHQEREEASERQAEEDKIVRLEARQARRQNRISRIGGFLGQNTRT